MHAQHATVIPQGGQTGIVRVTVLRAVHIPPVKLPVTVVLTLGELKYSTSKNSAPDPEWNETKDFRVVLRESAKWGHWYPERPLQVDVFDAKVPQPTLLGRAVIPLKEILRGETQAHSVNLDQGGSIDIAVSAVDWGMEPRAPPYGSPPPERERRHRHRHSDRQRHISGSPYRPVPGYGYPQGGYNDWGYPPPQQLMNGPQMNPPMMGGPPPPPSPQYHPSPQYYQPPSPGYGCPPNQAASAAAHVVEAAIHAAQGVLSVAGQVPATSLSPTHPPPQLLPPPQQSMPHMLPFPQSTTVILQSPPTPQGVAMSPTGYYMQCQPCQPTPTAMCSPVAPVQCVDFSTMGGYDQGMAPPRRQEYNNSAALSAAMSANDELNRLQQTKQELERKIQQNMEELQKKEQNKLLAEKLQRDMENQMIDKERAQLEQRLKELNDQQRRLRRADIEYQVKLNSPSQSTQSINQVQVNPVQPLQLYSFDAPPSMPAPIRTKARRDPPTFSPRGWRSPGRGFEEEEYYRHVSRTPKRTYDSPMRSHSPSSEIYTDSMSDGSISPRLY